MNESHLKIILVTLILPNVSGVKYEEEGSGGFSTTPMYMKQASLEERIQEAKKIAEKIIEGVK